MTALDYNKILVKAATLPNEVRFVDANDEPMEGWEPIKLTPDLRRAFATMMLKDKQSLQTCVRRAMRAGVKLILSRDQTTKSALLEDTKTHFRGITDV